MEYAVSSAASEALALSAVGPDVSVTRLEHDARDVHVRMQYAARCALGMQSSVPAGGSLVVLCAYAATIGGKRSAEDSAEVVAYCLIRAPRLV